MRLALSLSLVFTLAVPQVAGADPMRCGKWVVNEQATTAELLEKCGEPQRRESKSEEAFGKNALGYRVKLGTAVTEHWFYQRGSGSLPMLVTIVDGKVKRIERTK